MVITGAFEVFIKVLAVVKNGLGNGAYHIEVVVVIDIPKIIVDLVKT